MEAALGADATAVLRQVLALDPRPQYQNDANKTYGMPFEGRDVRFTVQGNVLTVVEIV